MTYLLTFHTHLDALAFMRFAKSAGTAERKPVPRRLSSSCGTCVVFTPACPDAERKMQDMRFEKLYHFAGTGWNLLREKE